MTDRWIVQKVTGNIPRLHGNEGNISENKAIDWIEFGRFLFLFNFDPLYSSIINVFSNIAVDVTL